MSLWRIGWTGLLGALAGAVLFPRPARGGRRAERDPEPGPGLRRAGSSAQITRPDPEPRP